jgi:hypothetical protein
MTDNLLKRLQEEIPAIRRPEDMAKVLATLERCRSEREMRMKRNVRALRQEMTPDEARAVVLEYLDKLDDAEFEAFLVIAQSDRRAKREIDEMESRDRFETDESLDAREPESTES